MLVRQKSIELAAKDGAALLEKLKKGESAEAKWSAPQTVTRERREGLHPEAAEAVFRPTPRNCLPMPANDCGRALRAFTA